MANRSFGDKQGLMLIKRVVRLYPVFSVGVAGAVTLKKRQFTAMGATSVAASSSLVSAPTTGVGYAVGDGAGVRSVTRTGSGAWTITLSDPYQYLLGVGLALTSNSTGGLTAVNVGVNSSGDVTTNTAVGNGGTIKVVFSSAASTAADPGTTDTLVLELILGDATEP